MSQILSTNQISDFLTQTLINQSEFKALNCNQSIITKNPFCS